MASKLFLVVADVRYAYNGMTYKKGDTIEIGGKDLAGFDMRDLKQIKGGVKHDGSTESGL